jgi:hypothetical protein
MTDRREIAERTQVVHSCSAAGGNEGHWSRGNGTACSRTFGIRFEDSYKKDIDLHGCTLPT